MVIQTCPVVSWIDVDMRFNNCRLCLYPSDWMIFTLRGIPNGISLDSIVGFQIVTCYLWKNKITTSLCCLLRNGYNEMNVTLSAIWQHVVCQTKKGSYNWWFWLFELEIWRGCNCQVCTSSHCRTVMICVASPLLQNKISSLLHSVNTLSNAAVRICILSVHLIMILVALPLNLLCWLSCRSRLAQIREKGEINGYTHSSCIIQLHLKTTQTGNYKYFARWKLREENMMNEKYDAVYHFL